MPQVGDDIAIPISASGIVVQENPSLTDLGDHLTKLMESVLGTVFPNCMSAKTRELRGRTLRFITEKSFRQFAGNASYFLGVDFDPLVPDSFHFADSIRTE